MPQRIRIFVALLAFVVCSIASADEDPFLLILGTAQDAGFPQAGCKKACCADAWKHRARQRYTASLAIIDPVSKQRWIIDATPNFREQLQMVDEVCPSEQQRSPVDGILLTHGHIGHYTGLMHLGREVIGAKAVPVFAMPRMEKFLQTNGPWSQLVKLNNIRLTPIREEKVVTLNARISVTPFLVPHRDEFTETVGFKIQGPKRSAIYLPDIDKWERWQTKIEDLVADVDIAFVDGSFFDNEELPGRDMSLIPHPFVVESIDRFKDLPRADRSKVRFIHLNHTNQLLHSDSAAQKIVKQAGHYVAKQGERHSI